MDVTRRKFLKLCIAAGVSGLIASYPVLIERYIVLLNTYRIAVPKLPEVFRGFRIVQLTDLHYGFFMPLVMIADVVRRVNRLSGDIVVCTGDYVHQHRTSVQMNEVWPILSRLHARSGVYSVLGNHDHWADTERSLYWLKKSGQDLRHKVRFVERYGKKLWLIGGGDYWEDHVAFDEFLGRIPERDCRIVLAHNPDSADTEHEGRIDLMISGHTHGGQVRIPFYGTPMLPVKNKNYSSGLKKSKKDEYVFISKGIGGAIYPLRFNCYPEIAILVLEPAMTTLT